MRKPEKDKEFIYLGAVVASVLSIVQAGGGLLPQIAGIAIYILAGILLVAACIFFVQDLKKGVIEKIFSAIKRNPLGEKFFGDYTFRIILTTLPTFAINVAYTVYNGVLGIMHQSAWFITMTVYYSLLGIMRYHAVQTERKISRLEDQRLVRKKRTLGDKNGWHPAYIIKSGFKRRCFTDHCVGYSQKIFGNHGYNHSGIYVLQNHYLCDKYDKGKKTPVSYFDHYSEYRCG